MEEEVPASSATLPAEILLLPPLLVSAPDERMEALPPAPTLTVPTWTARVDSKAKFSALLLVTVWIVDCDELSDRVKVWPETVLIPMVPP